MSLNADDVQKIAKLAQLDISETTSNEFEASLTSILDLVASMDSVNTDDIEPMAHPLHATQRLREDIVTEHNQRDALQAHAPVVENGLFVVPKVIE